MPVPELKERCPLADKIERDGLTAGDLHWIGNTMPEMSQPMLRLTIMLLILDNTRLRKPRKGPEQPKGAEK